MAPSPKARLPGFWLINCFFSYQQSSRDLLQRQTFYVCTDGNGIIISARQIYKGTESSILGSRLLPMYRAFQRLTFDFDAQNSPRKFYAAKNCRKCIGKIQSASKSASLFLSPSSRFPLRPALLCDRPSPTDCRWLRPTYRSTRGPSGESRAHHCRDHGLAVWAVVLIGQVPFAVHRLPLESPRDGG